MSFDAAAGAAEAAGKDGGGKLGVRGDGSAWGACDVDADDADDGDGDDVMSAIEA